MIRVPAPSFGAITKARFVSRPNRFRVECEALKTGKAITAFLPNPGRLRELFLPNATLYVADTPGETRKTRHTIIAVERDKAPVFLHTHTNNQVAAHLLTHGKLPGLENAELLAQEVRHNRSRFDMLIRLDGDEVFAEVKSVTLFGNGVAMFPDAVTERGKKHLLELAQMRKGKKRHVVIFMVHTKYAHTFMPDYHTDLAFTQALLATQRDLRIVPVSVSWTPRLRLGKSIHSLHIPWEHVEREAIDAGAYLIITRAKKRVGATDYHEGVSKGQYVMLIAGAARDLARTAARKRRKADDPFAALSANSETWDPILIRGSRIDLPALCDAFGALGAPLYKADAAGAGERWAAIAMPDDPQSLPAFHRTLETFRMVAPPPSAA